MRRPLRPRSSARTVAPRTRPMTPWRQANRMRTVPARLPSASSVPGRRARGRLRVKRKRPRAPCWGSRRSNGLAAHICSIRSNAEGVHLLGSFEPGTAELADCCGAAVAGAGATGAEEPPAARTACPGPSPRPAPPAWIRLAPVRHFATRSWMNLPACGSPVGAGTIFVGVEVSAVITGGDCAAAGGP
jgi:hypothetical protein